MVVRLLEEEEAVAAVELGLLGREVESEVESEEEDKEEVEEAGDMVRLAPGEEVVEAEAGFGKLLASSKSAKFSQLELLVITQVGQAHLLHSFSPGAKPTQFL